MNHKNEVEVDQNQLARRKETCDPINIESNTGTPTIHNTPPGKCPIRVRCKDGKFQDVDLKEPYHSQGHHVIQELTATQDEDIAKEIMLRGLSAMPQQKQLEHNFNTVFQSLSDSAPKDSTEAKLCLQSTVLYAQGMWYIEKAESCNRIDHSEFYMKNAIKLLRLHNETIEALSKYRRDGEQKVVVQHVQVNDGGQAIVGSVLKGGGGKQ